MSAATWMMVMLNLAHSVCLHKSPMMYAPRKECIERVSACLEKAQTPEAVKECVK